MGWGGVGRRGGREGRGGGSSHPPLALAPMCPAPVGRSGECGC